MLQKRLYCNAKVPVLPRKTGTFTMQNNRYCNALITWRLHDCYSSEKYLHNFCFVFAHLFSIIHYKSTISQAYYVEKK